MIEEEFPVELTITQGNFERLFQCPSAIAAEVQNLTTEYSGNIGFGRTLRYIKFVGKVLTSNVFHILRQCPDLEVLRFASLRNVLGIEGAETIKLPKTTIIEIRVRPDQETFTSDEIIIISAIRQMLFGSLETLLISTGNPNDVWDEDDDDDESEYGNSQMMSADVSLSKSVAGGIMSQSSVRLEDQSSGALTRVILSPVVSRGTEDLRLGESDQLSAPVVALGLDSTGTDDSLVSNVEGQQSAGTQTANPNLHVLVNRGATFPGNVSESVATATSSSSSTRRVRYNLSEFEARMFYANLELLTDNMWGSTVAGNILNDSVSQTRIDSTAYFEVQGLPTPAVKHTLFFEFVRNNQATLKNLYVKTRSDFMCFGNLSSFSKDLSKVQFEEVEYSFGRMQMCYEYTLLRAQSKMKKLRIQILDDMWKHLMVAVQQSQGTLQDLDVKVMSVGEEHVDTNPIKGCTNLKSLKLLHFFEKQSICLLPKSLNKLIINGPILYSEMDVWTRDLTELIELTLLLNVRGDRIDLYLYKKFLKMPKMARLTLIQCPMDLDDIKEYIDTKLGATGPEFKFVINGPRNITELPTIQYVYTVIDPDKFNREQIELVEEAVEIN